MRLANLEVGVQSIPIRLSSNLSLSLLTSMNARSAVWHSSTKATSFSRVSSLSFWGSCGGRNTWLTMYWRVSRRPASCCKLILLYNWVVGARRRFEVVDIEVGVRVVFIYLGKQDKMKECSQVSFLETSTLVGLHKFTCNEDGLGWILNILPLCTWNSVVLPDIPAVRYTNLEITKHCSYK